jgi:hypothetical protein
MPPGAAGALAPPAPRWRRPRSSGSVDSSSSSPRSRDRSAALAGKLQDQEYQHGEAREVSRGLKPTELVEQGCGPGNQVGGGAEGHAPSAARSRSRNRIRRREWSFSEERWFRGTIDVKPHDLSGFIQINVQSVGDFPHLGARLRPQLDVEAVCFGMVMQLHGGILSIASIKKRIVDRLAVLQRDEGHAACHPVDQRLVPTIVCARLLAWTAAAEWRVWRRTIGVTDRAACAEPAPENIGLSLACHHSSCRAVRFANRSSVTIMHLPDAVQLRPGQAFARA